MEKVRLSPRDRKMKMTEAKRAQKEGRKSSEKKSNVVTVSNS